MKPDHSTEQMASFMVMRQVHRLMRKHTDFEEFVADLHRNGLLVRSLATCNECPNPTMPGSDLCWGHYDLHEYERSAPRNH